jgi:hypothetical protein
MSRPIERLFQWYPLNLCMILVLVTTLVQAVGILLRNR